MKNELNQAFVALILAALLPLSLMAQSGITEPGATEPNQLYTTTLDNPDGSNQTPGGPNRAIINPGDIDQDPDSPIGAPWALLAFAAAYAGVRLVKRGKKGVEE